MREPTISRNYAEALLSLAQKANDLDGWGAMITEFADAVESDSRLRGFLASPRMSAKGKVEIITQAFNDRLPRLFVRFLAAVIVNRRQHLIPQIATEYALLVDEVQGRVHARVTVAREASEAEVKDIAARLSRLFGKDVVPHMAVDPSIMGGLVVNVGDTVLDGSVRKRLATLRRRMLGRSRVG